MRSLKGSEEWEEHQAQGGQGQHFRSRKRRPLRKQGRGQKDTWEYQENRRVENVYRLKEGEGDGRQMENPGVFREDE